MLRKFFQNIGDWLEDGIRRVIRPLSPDTRVVVIVVMLIAFSALSIYTVVSSIYNFGKDRGLRLQIEQIETLRFNQQEQQRDSINQQEHQFEYEPADE